jgi:Cys-Gly metallodipeptidase DUG1
MNQVFEYVEKNQDYFVKRLAEVVAIPSVSGDVEHRPHVFRMGQWLEKELKALGAR